LLLSTESDLQLPLALPYVTFPKDAQLRLPQMAQPLMFPTTTPKRYQRQYQYLEMGLRSRQELLAMPT
jgi:hypothetical protein